MVKKMKELVMTKDMTFDESIEVEGSIHSATSERFSLKVRGGIDAWNIDAWNIDAWNIDAGNIDAWNIDAGNIICETRRKKEKTSKTICCVFVQKRSKIEHKERMPE